MTGSATIAVIEDEARIAEAVRRDGLGRQAAARSIRHV
jgi:hypothetical protein